MKQNKGLTSDQISFFKENGYIGPFTLFEPEEMNDFWHQVRIDLLDKSDAAFPGNPLNYDRHLDLKCLNDIVTSNVLVDKLTSILGEDLLCWRTEWFPKYPGDEATDWHQAQTFVEFEGKEKLSPTENVDDPWELTVWTAFTDATKENGCMKVMPKTHHTWYFDEKKNISYNPEEINQMEKDGKKTGFFGYNWDLLKHDPEWIPDENKAKHLEMKAGQFFIFTSRCLHASEPNITKNLTRIGFATRFVSTHVRVYPDQESFSHFGQRFDLSKYSTVLVSGQDEYGHNTVRKPLV